jgi:GxxExxY protein
MRKRRDRVDSRLSMMYIMLWGYGSLERVYESAFAIELSKKGFHVKKQSPIKVYYDGEWTYW